MKLDFLKPLRTNREKRVNTKLETIVLTIVVFGLIVTILFLAGGN